MQPSSRAQEFVARMIDATWFAYDADMNELARHAFLASLRPDGAVFIADHRGSAAVVRPGVFVTAVFRWPPQPELMTIGIVLAPPPCALAVGQSLTLTLADGFICQLQRLAGGAP